jgi:hypothetical protein
MFLTSAALNRRTQNQDGTKYGRNKRFTVITAQVRRHTWIGPNAKHLQGKNRILNCIMLAALLAKGGALLGNNLTV